MHPLVGPLCAFNSGNRKGLFVFQTVVAVFLRRNDHRRSAVDEISYWQLRGEK